MRVVLLAETYSKKMGYSEGCLAKALARLGLETHLVTLDLPPYYYMPDFQATYGAFLEASPRCASIEEIDGYTVHYMPHRRQLGYMRMQGLFAKLKSLRPDIVQAPAAIGWIPLDTAVARPRLGFRLFTASHTAASTFPLASRKSNKLDAALVRAILTRWIPGRCVSLLTEKCYAVTGDAAEIAVRFFGVQREKVEVMHLGVDTDVFFPAPSEKQIEERQRLRQQLGVQPDDILCVYSGKMTDAKNVLVLAEAISQLRAMNEPFMGLFIGDGVQQEAIRSHPGCLVHPFMPFQELAPYYRAADIGVWPSRIESTSILDAAACGIPIVVSDLIYREPVEGNGSVYRTNDADDLVRALLALRDPEDRKRLGAAGATKMAQSWSWDSVARRRLADYEAAVRIRATESSARSNA